MSNWLTRIFRPEPPRPRFLPIVDCCAAWTPWEQWHDREVLASVGIGPGPCRHWHVRDYQLPETYGTYWTQHWLDRHDMIPPSPPAREGVVG
jgi:hypothetical protein